VASSSRVVFVDLLRFVAAIQMLQGHTIAALLAPSYRHGAVYGVWSTARGLTSVAFLFAAGLSFYLATERDAASGSRRRVLRALRLIGLGYLLHLPVAALATDSSVRVRALHEFLAVDVLQCIGASILLLEALRALVADLRLRIGSAVALALGVFLLAPAAATVDASGWLRPILAYATPTAGSIFPLTPWSAHVFAGYASGALVRAGGTGNSNAPRLWQFLGVRLAVVTAVVAAFACALQWLDAPRVLLDHASRSAGVLASAWLLWFAGERLSRVPAIVSQLGQHTLILYVFHVLLVYGHGVGLATWIGPSLPPLWAVLAAVFVIVVSAAVALSYDRLARARRTG
jgi:acyltransferase